MKKSLIVILSFLLFNALYGQYTGYSPDIVLKLNTGSQQTLATTATAYVSSVNLTGNFNELIIVVGFPDRTHSYPRLTNDAEFPLLGAFPDGTLLSDYINSHGGSISADEWYRPALTDFFSNQSGGLYTVNFSCPKQANGDPYLTTRTFAGYIADNGSGVSVVKSKNTNIASDIVNNVYNANPSLFNNVKALHLVFTGITQDEFYHEHGGFVDPGNTYTITSSVTGAVIFNGPIDFQMSMGAIAHERMHMIGAISGSPSGFKGFPDRGYDEVVDYSYDHCNLLWNYDIMYHNASIPEQHSLYGLPPITSHDLIFLGWIRPEEILTVNASTVRNVDFSTIKLSDINVPLTSTQISNGYRRIIKVMINENHTGDRDEYFLIEYHKATGFDKNFANYDEYAQSGYNKGILVWHIKEIQDAITAYADNLIDLETAVPYNGSFGYPIPDDSYPRGSYTRSGNWNGQRAGDFDYLDDDRCSYVSGTYVPKGGWVFNNMPDGGRTLWEVTTYSPTRTWGWWPTDPNLPRGNVFKRLSSLKSDFFTDEVIKGVVTNKMTEATRPSTKDWGGALKHIAITNMIRENDYMKLNVFYNYFASTNTTLSGNVTFESDAYVPLGSTLSIASGATVTFKNGASLIVNGTLIANAGNITFQRGETTGRWGNIVFDGAGAANSELNNMTLNDGTEIRCLNGANVKIWNSYFTNFKNGIYVYNSQPEIMGNHIINPLENGIYGEASAASPFILDNVITKDASSPQYHHYQGLFFLNNSSPYIAHNDVSGFDWGLYAGGSTYVYFTDNSLSTFCPNNRFRDNRVGFASGWGSFVYAGSEGVAGWYNTIMDNTNYDAYSYESSWILAQSNYWGGVEPKTYKDYDSYLEIYDNIEEDPWEGGAIPYVLRAESSAGKKTSMNKTNLNDSENIPFNLLEGVKLEKAGKLDDAIAWYKTLVNSEKNQPFAMTELMRIKNKYSRADILSYMEGLTKVKKNSYLLKLLGDNYLQNNEFDKAIAWFDNAISSSASEKEALDARFSKLFAFINVKKDLGKAQEILSDIKKGKVSDFYFSSRIKIAENLMNDPSAYSMNKGEKQEKYGQSSENSGIVTEYALSQNYPNPFNPSTVINYDIPKASKVSLRVYDILGKEIAALVDGYKEMGRYSVQFNASSLPSGMYIYEIRANNFIKSGKMLLLK
ncbi:MAG: T9SS type A sorting domain-containing protein [Ignavibacteria bacterium]|jgi:hypothetical protein|nr:T9SS type A sorting domain-containing protein [Ignavibacteria bacterium]MCU7514161.1 T9SS type A sorting domain-containing protein [Ignavibacteria bacterium]MCU7522495.1 T9SS type A sorting domain-containing protein [Ignavibacteria bacterium]MCU7525879.1 T9SS type A sorting domain-containing protein [Ignavibacteria bacterium]